MIKRSTVLKNMFISVFVILLLLQTSIYSKNYLIANQRTNSDDEQKARINSKAAELANDLQSIVQLTDIQASEVKATLINYLTNVSIIQFTQRAGAREKTYDVKSDPPSDLQDLNLNYDDNSLENLRAADNEATAKLNNIISTSQITKWNDVKDSWWSKVIAVQYEDN